MKSIQEILKLSEKYLQERGVKNSKRVAEDVVSSALSLKRMDLYLNFDRPLHEPEIERCREYLKRRAKGEPLQYIIGEVEFLNTKIKVSPAVLIPRQETEILASMIIEELSALDLKGKVLWDICTGSGCLAISISKALPDLKLFASDISRDALLIAQENAKNASVEVNFLEGDLLNPFKGMKADFIVCNPPYVSEDEYPLLEREVKEFEPKLSLVAKEGGLEFYQRLHTDLASHLLPHSIIWLEIGSLQGLQIQEIFQEKPSKILKDWSGLDRFIKINWLDVQGCN